MAIGFLDALGGAQQQILSLAPVMARLGVEVSVVTRRIVRGTPLRERAPGTTIYRVPEPPGHAPGAAAHIGLGGAVTAALRPDVIHVHRLGASVAMALMAARPRRAPVVVKILSAGTRGDVDQVRRSMGPGVLHAMLRRIPAFVCLSDEVERELMDNGVPAARLRRIPNGVDVERFHPPGPGEREEERRRLDVPVEPPLVLYCGRFSPVKRLDVLLEAVSGLDAHVLLVGEGTEEEALRRRASEPDLRGRVHFRARVEDAAPLYRAADAYASTSATEGMSGSVLEAMASGLPVAAAPASGMAELLAGGAGVPAEDRSAAAVRAALARIVADGEGAARVGAAARRRVCERYSLETTAERLVALYDEVRTRRRP
jgi:glycosyltransferase involved in cell wall biosynthesis